MHEEDIDEPASVIVTNVYGHGYDIKNIPGFKRQQLIENGEINIESFVHADNMPGAKLLRLRNKFTKNNSVQVNGASTPSIDINSLAEGSLVEYKKIVTEVRKINVAKELVYITAKDNKKVWVNVAKLKAVNIPRNDED